MRNRLIEEWIEKAGKIKVVDGKGGFKIHTYSHKAIEEVTAIEVSVFKSMNIIRLYPLRKRDDINFFYSTTNTIGVWKLKYLKTLKS